MKLKIALMAAVMSVGVFMWATPVAVNAQADDVRRGVQYTGDAGTDPAEGSLSTLVRKVLSVLSIVVGVVSVIMIIVGGFQYVISGGDSSKVGNAKNTILYAIIGLVIVAFAQIIVNFVLTTVAGA